VLLLAEADWKAWEIEETEWKLATRNSLKGEKRALQCELIFSWFLFILQNLQIAQASVTTTCSKLRPSRSIPVGRRQE
jgi:hypothetical protein